MGDRTTAYLYLRREPSAQMLEQIEEYSDEKLGDLTWIFFEVNWACDMPFDLEGEDYVWQFEDADNYGPSLYVQFDGKFETFAHIGGEIVVSIDASLMEFQKAKRWQKKVQLIRRRIT